MNTEKEERVQIGNLIEDIQTVIYSTPLSLISITIFPPKNPHILTPVPFYTASIFEDKDLGFYQSMDEWCSNKIKHSL